MIYDGLCICDHFASTKETPRCNDNMPDFPKPEPTDGPSPTDGPGPGPSKTCYNCGYKCSDMVRKYHTENATYPYPTGKSRSIWAKNGHSDNKFPDHCLFIVQILLNI